MVTSQAPLRTDKETSRVDGYRTRAIITTVPRRVAILLLPYFSLAWFALLLPLRLRHKAPALPSRVTTPLAITARIGRSLSLSPLLLSLSLSLFSSLPPPSLLSLSLCSILLYSFSLSLQLVPVLLFNLFTPPFVFPCLYIRSRDIFVSPSFTRAAH